MSDPSPARLGHGIHTVPLPLPFPSPRWVNVYLIECGSRLLMLDCGADWEPARTALQVGMAELGLDAAAVEVLVVTHLHPDHVGMAPRIQEEWGAPLAMHELAATGYQRYNDTPGQTERNHAFARRHGVPAALVPEVADLGPRPDFMPLLKPPDRTVADGERIPCGEGRWLEVLHTPGHEAAHICLRDSRSGILLSGDHILPRISPVVMYDEERHDVLGDYLSSLRRLASLEVGLTLPAHGAVVERGRERAEQILLHHARRLAEMEEVVREEAPTTAWQVMRRVFRPHLSSLEQRLALRETVAHLEHLRLAGRLAGRESDGVVRYRPATGASV